MIILGIDTALRCTGYGVVDFTTADRIRALDCGVIKTKASAPHSECLRRLAGGMRELVEKYHPNVAVLESAFYQKNIKTAMILSYARGAVMTVFAENNIPMYAYAPTKAKLSVCGNGAASKDQVAYLIAGRLGLNVKDMPLDSSDALALAICHGQIATSPMSQHLMPESI
ncbi:MAG TPA: crossover junction endodeoxyribonuclease RuvC [Lentisphaeria bacterium]|nr:MAG: crossover junction endodeoxyribonuclease RuvC [Lentisphaerae bacterium GWF2_49_21]HBC86409.1 crossover junction endodeoxyribonuclease RuvC [Lentisphaeria bacterium]